MKNHPDISRVLVFASWPQPEACEAAARRRQGRSLGLTVTGTLEEDDEQ